MAINNGQNYIKQFLDWAGVQTLWEHIKSYVTTYHTINQTIKDVQINGKSTINNKNVNVTLIKEIVTGSTSEFASTEAVKTYVDGKTEVLANDSITGITINSNLTVYSDASDGKTDKKINIPLETQIKSSGNNLVDGIPSVDAVTGYTDGLAGKVIVNAVKAGTSSSYATDNTIILNPGGVDEASKNEYDIASTAGVKDYVDGKISNIQENIITGVTVNGYGVDIRTDLTYTDTNAKNINLKLEDDLKAVTNYGENKISSPDGVKNYTSETIKITGATINRKGTGNVNAITIVDKVLTIPTVEIVTNDTGKGATKLVTSKAVYDALNNVETGYTTNLQSVYRFRGTKASLAQIQSVSKPANGDVYNASDTGMNYAWSEKDKKWDALGGEVYDRISDDDINALSDEVPTDIIF